MHVPTTGFRCAPPRIPTKATMSSLPNQPPPPSTAAIVFATAILSALGGYFIGQGVSIGLFSRSSAKKQSWPNSYDVTIHPDSSDEEVMKSLQREGVDRNAEEDEDSDSEPDYEPGELSTFEGNKEECKLVLAVRTDLGMTKGTLYPAPPHLSPRPEISLPTLASLSRKNRRTVLSRDPSLLQTLPRPFPGVPHPPPLGIPGPSQSRRASKERG